MCGSSRRRSARRRCRRRATSSRARCLRARDYVRRINVESKASFILTAAQAVVFVAITAVLLSFVKWSAVAELWSMRADTSTWIYAMAGLAIAAAFGMSRWLAQES